VSRKRIIRKLLVLGAWIAVISGVTTLLVAANRKSAGHACREVVIGIKGSGEKFYIEKGDILKTLEATAGGTLMHRSLAAIDLSKLEQKLEGDQWIRDAELYFDREGVLHVFVEEREPVARVFTTAGQSFYIDSSGHRMPLLEKVSARVPVFTGFTAARKLRAKDSALLASVKTLASIIYHHPFWQAQTGQVDILPDGKFEIIPVIGDHIVKLGAAEHLEDKLERVLLFYKQVMQKTGFHKYAAVDVQFARQVIGVHKGTVSAVDSIQLQKNIKELLEKSTIQHVSNDMLPDARTAPAPVVLPLKDSVKGSVKTLPAPSNPEKTTPVSRPAQAGIRQKPVKSQPPAKPKAVMPRKG